MARFEIPEGWSVQAYQFALAPRFFPSTRLCSQCGVKTKLRLRDRIYRCRNGCLSDV